MTGSGHSYKQNSGHCPSSQIINLQVLVTGSLLSGARGAVSPIPPTHLNTEDDLASKASFVFNLGSWKCPQYQSPLWLNKSVNICN